VLVIISLPMVLAAAEAMSFYARNAANGRLTSSGLRREYLLYVPGSYDSSRPTPLVISMHGGALWPAAQREMSGWNRVADRHGIVVVYPSGVKDGGPRHWDMDRDGLSRNVRFISELIDTLRSRYNIDTTRVYADGLSNGGGMAFALSCTIPDRLAAVGMVASAQLLPWSWCADTSAVPMIAFHGTADQAVPYAGGRSWVAPRAFPSIPRWAALWARRNRCASGPLDSAVAGDVTRRTYTNCAAGADVVLYTVHGGGHSWPGAKPVAEWFIGPTTRSIDASQVSWEFFRRHSLAGRRY
jgi:polyhydroxybutyrate depolymerase